MKIQRLPKTGPNSRWICQTRWWSLELYPTWNRWGLPFLAQDVWDRTCGVCIPIGHRRIVGVFWGSAR